MVLIMQPPEGIVIGVIGPSWPFVHLLNGFQLVIIFGRFDHFVVWCLLICGWVVITLVVWGVLHHWALLRGDVELLERDLEGIYWRLLLCLPALVFIGLSLGASAPQRRGNMGSDIPALIHEKELLHFWILGKSVDFLGCCCYVFMAWVFQCLWRSLIIDLAGVAVE